MEGTTKREVYWMVDLEYGGSDRREYRARIQHRVESADIDSHDVDEALHEALNRVRGEADEKLHQFRPWKIRRLGEFDAESGHAIGAFPARIGKEIG